MAQSNLFIHKSTEDAETITKYLTALKEGFEKGALLFSSDERKLVLTPRGLINVEIKAKRKGEEIKLSLKLRWVEEAESHQEKSQALTIQSMSSV